MAERKRLCWMTYSSGGIKLKTGHGLTEGISISFTLFVKDILLCDLGICEFQSRKIDADEEKSFYSGWPSQSPFMIQASHISSLISSTKKGCSSIAPILNTFVKGTKPIWQITSGPALCLVKRSMLFRVNTVDRVDAQVFLVSLLLICPFEAIHTEYPCVKLLENSASLKNWPNIERHVRCWL